MKTESKRKYQVRPAEARVCGTDVEELVRLSTSEEVENRRLAAELLCPCHVRRRVEAAWDALFRLMEDTDPKVRFAAWHTLEDGGNPGDPRLPAIARRVLVYEANVFIRRMAGEVVRGEETRTQIAQQASLSRATVRGRCDFCGADGVPVDNDLGTMIPTYDLPRPARACARCRA